MARAKSITSVTAETVWALGTSMLAGGASEPTRWRSFDIQFQRVAEAELADENGTPYAASAT